MKESDWVLKNFHQSENGLLETGVKSDVAFCLGPSIEKTNSAMYYELGRFPEN